MVSVRRGSAKVESCERIFISRRLLKIRTAFMEGDKKRVKEPDRIEEAKTNPQRIQEYEFFVNEGEGETEEALPEDRHAKVIKRRKGDRNKSRTFFLD